jgi:pseudouridine-5'-phosphate glycosidase
MQPFLDPLPEVAAALAARRPVVALESTIVAHGMPWPHNLETALRVEDEVRAHGSIPATIAVVAGRLKVGLARDEIERIARAGPSIDKLSRRDLPIVLARGGNGATTVAATMIVAAMAGIRVFATGGIGGVHRDAASTFDISADLQELARTPVAVVCAGAKAVLDLRLTLEYLETLGVPVIGYRTDRLPAFWVRDSGLHVDARIDDATGVARVMAAKWRMGLAGGIVVANPIPEPYAMGSADVERAIAAALEDASKAGIEGKAVTPFLLARINAATSGDSLRSNVELVVANARLAADIAVAYSALERDDT